MDTCCGTWHNPDLGIFLIRLALGAIFLVHGWMKFQDIAGTINFFSGLGLAEFLAYLVATMELVGGILMIIGIYTRLAGLMIAAVMIGAIYFVKFKVGFVGGYEFDLILLAAALGVTFTGGGKYALMQLFDEDCPLS